MSERVCVLTGAASGIGRAAALQLQSSGMRLVLVDRDGAGLQGLAEELVLAGAPAPELHTVDLSLMDNVRQLSEILAAQHPHIDVLCNNAGVLCERRQLTAEGFELTLAVNYLAPFLMTRLLLEPLHRSPAARVVSTSSLAHGHGRIHLDDMNISRGYHLYKSYAQSKLALMLFTRSLARRSEGTRLSANCFHPGVVGTGIGEGGFNRLISLASPFIRRPERGARTLSYLADSPEVADARGLYFIDERPRRPRARGRDDVMAERLWTHTEGLLGLEPPA